MSTPYRDAAPVPIAPLEEHVGARHKCPACGYAVPKHKDFKNHEYGPLSQYTHISLPTFCSADQPMRIGLFCKCQRKDPHLHQHCAICGAKWMCKAQSDPRGAAPK